MSLPAYQAPFASLAGLGLALPAIPYSYSLSEYHTCMEALSDAEYHSALTEVTPFPSPSAEHIVYPRRSRVELTQSTELASAIYPELDNLPDITSPFIHSGEMEDHEPGYEAGCEGEAHTPSTRARRGHKRKHNRVARVAGVAPSAPKYKRARAYACSGIGRGLPGGVSPRTQRRTACLAADPKCKRARAYAGIGLGLPSGVFPRELRATACIISSPIVDAASPSIPSVQRVARPTLERGTWPIAPSPSLLPSPQFSTNISMPHVPSVHIQFSIAPSPSVLPTPFPIHRLHIRNDSPITNTNTRPVRPSPHPIQRPPRPARLPLAQIGLGLGINIPIAPSPVPESPYNSPYAFI